jgi:hypothetical protein
MAKFQSPLLGYNNNVRHKNRVFHIQTEDSGVNHPHIITHLFMDGGRILKSVKKSYAEHVGSEGMKEIVRGLMKEQHKAIFIALRDGQFDGLVDAGAVPKPAAAAAPVTPPAAAPVAAVAAAAPASRAEPARPTSSAELAPATIDESKRPASIVPPSSAALIKGPRIEALPPSVDSEDVPMTTRQPPEARPDAAAASKPARELTLDFDALELAAQDAVAAPSLFHSTDLPPPPKNLFARESGTGGAYRAVEASPPDSHEEPEGAGPVSKPQPRAPGRGVGSRPPGEARYAPARPAAIFGSTQRPPPASLFSDELVSDKSLDEVILSYLAEDLEPPRRK